MNGPSCFPLQFWTESFVQWSPLGTYLATVHRQGAAVWGGANTFNRLMRYAHPQVEIWFLASDFTLCSPFPRHLAFLILTSGKTD